MEQIRLISVRELDTYVNLYPQITLLDVRTEEEYHASHIRHAVNIPYREGIVWKLPRWKKGYSLLRKRFGKHDGGKRTAETWIQGSLCSWRNSGI